MMLWGQGVEGCQPNKEQCATVRPAAQVRVAFDILTERNVVRREWAHGGMETAFRDENGVTACGPGGPASREVGVSIDELETRRSGMEFAWLSIFDSIQEPVTVWRSNQERVICFCALEWVKQHPPPCSDTRRDVIKIELIAGPKNCDSVRRSFG